MSENTERRYLKWYNKVGYGSGDVAGNVVYTRFEEAQRFFDENKEPQIGFSIEDIAKKLLGDDYTEDWYPEEEQERDRRNMVISSYIASTTAALFWWVDG